MTTRQDLTDSEKLFDELDQTRDYFLDEGAIEEAIYCIAAPMFYKTLSNTVTTEISNEKEQLAQINPNKVLGVLIFCHGCRPEGIELTNDLDLHDGAYLTLLKTGFIVAMTSYRREGRILLDAIEDVANLRALILKKYVVPYYTAQDSHASSEQIENRIRSEFSIVIEGESMGGHIGTLIAELRPELADGVLTVGAALIPKGNEKAPPFTHDPKIPLLHLITTSETTQLKLYQDKCLEKGNKNCAVWTSSHEGHCSIHWKERIAGLRGLLGWIRASNKYGQRIPLSNSKNHSNNNNNRPPIEVNNLTNNGVNNPANNEDNNLINNEDNNLINNEDNNLINNEDNNPANNDNERNEMNTSNLSLHDIIPQVPPIFSDVTIKTPKISSIRFEKPDAPSSGGAFGSIVRYNVYGDLLLDFVPSDLDALGITKLLSVKIQVDRGPPQIFKTLQAYRASSGDAFDVNVPMGAFMVYETNNNVYLCCNGSLLEPANAANFISASAGMAVFIKKADPPAPKKLNLAKYGFLARN